MTIAKVLILAAACVVTGLTLLLRYKNLHRWIFTYLRTPHRRGAPAKTATST